MTMQTKVYFDNKHTRQYADLYLNSIGDANIDIYEYEKIVIGLESDDKDAVLIVEVYDNEGTVTIKNDESRVFSEEGYKDDMLVPGDYLITIKTKKGIYESIFRIKPKTLTWESLLRLKEYLENIASGIIYDIYRNRLGLNVDGLKINPSILDTYKYILETFPTIKNVLNILIKKSPTDIKKVYKVTTISRIPDTKSQRWLIQKGLTRNQNPYIPDKVYEKHTQLTVNTIENRWLKTILLILKQILREIEKSFDNIHKSNYDKKIDLETKKQETLKSIESAGNDYGTEKYKEKLNEKNKILDNNIEEMKKKIVATQKDSNKIDNIVGIINYYLNETWLKEVETLKSMGKPTLKLQKDKYYSIIYNFYRKINQYRKREVSENRYTFPHKTTAKLYEYYIFFVTIEILKSLGYQLEESIFDNGIRELTAGTTVKLFKEDHFITLAYDKKLEKCPIKEDVSYFEPNQNDRPDIRLAVYKSDEEFIAAMILEVKCRRYRNIYKKNIPTNTILQIRDYLKILYFDIVRKSKGEVMNVPNPIKQVIVVYPKQQEGKAVEYIEYHRYGEQLVFLQLSPANEANASFGYDNLKNLINNFLIKWTRI